MKRLMILFGLGLYVVGRSVCGAQGSGEDWLARVRAACQEPPSRPRRVMLVFPLVEAGSEDGEIGWGRGLIALQAMWVSSFAPDRLLDTWDFTVDWRFGDQQLFGAGRRVTPEKIEAVCAVLDAQNYVTGTLEVGPDRYVARLVLHGEKGVQEIEHAGPKSELPRLPCLIAVDVVAYLRVPITARQQEHLGQPPLSSVELFDEVAGRFHASYYFGTHQRWFWQSVAERCRTPWTEWMYLDACRAAESGTAFERWEEFAPETQSAALDFLKAQLTFARSPKPDAGRALAPLLTTDPYTPHVVRWLARTAGEVGEEELAESLLDRLVLLYGDGPLGPMHRGLCLIRRAWDARGGGWGSTVSSRGWELFHERLTRARADLEQALDTEPRCWVAAAYLIAVAKGLSLEPDYCEQRLAQATSACPTCFEAYSQMLDYMLPRWHGTRAGLLEFGRRCAATELYATAIPGLLIDAHADAASFSAARASGGAAAREALLEEYFTQPAVWQEVRPVLERLVSQNPYDYRDLTRYLAFAHWNGEADLSRRLLDRMPEQAWADGWHSLAFRDLSEDLHEEIRQWGSAGWPPAHTAARQGDLRAIEGLLANGTQVDQTMQGGLTLLHVAARHGRTQVVQALLAAGADANARADDGSTPLYLASKYGHGEAVSQLIGDGADVNAPGAEGPAPLLVAVQAGDEDIVRLLLREGADPNAVDEEGNGTVQLAAWAENTQMIRRLAASGADVNAANADGFTPLYNACYHDHKLVVEALLEAGADVNRPGPQGYLPLGAACYNGHTDVVQLLLRAGADPSTKNAAGYAPLYTACRQGRTRIVELLLEHGASLGSASDGDFTALHAAARKDHPDLVRMLIARGADVNHSQNRDGWTPLHSATREGNVECARLLIEAGGDVNAQAEGLRQPLHFAVRYGHPEAARFLLEKGAQPDAETLEGLTPLHLAATSGSKELVRIFLERGAFVNAVDNQGRTATGHAVKEGHHEIAELLREHGGVE